jgi:uncharacterized membrane protein (DUF4010 family)
MPSFFISAEKSPASDGAGPAVFSGGLFSAGAAAGFLGASFFVPPIILIRELTSSIVSSSSLFTSDNPRSDSVQLGTVLFTVKDNLHVSISILRILLLSYKNSCK